MPLWCGGRGSLRCEVVERPWPLLRLERRTEGLELVDGVTGEGVRTVPLSFKVTVSHYGSLPGTSR